MMDSDFGVVIADASDGRSLLVGTSKRGGEPKRGDLNIHSHIAYLQISSSSSKDSHLWTRAPLDVVLHLVM